MPTNFAKKGQALSLQPTCCGYCDFRKDQWQNMWSLVSETPTQSPHPSALVYLIKAWESEQKTTSAHLLQLPAQHRFRISQKLDAGWGSAIESQPCPESEAWVALETEETATSVDISRNGPTTEILWIFVFDIISGHIGLLPNFCHLITHQTIAIRTSALVSLTVEIKKKSIYINLCGPPSTLRIKD